MAGPPPALEPLIKQTDDWARGGDIDDTHHIAVQKIYIFDGYNDAVVDRTVTDAIRRFYFHYLPDLNRGNLFYQTAIGAGHAQVTLAYGSEGSANQNYFIDRLTRGHVPEQTARTSNDLAPGDLRVNDVSDTAVALA